MNKLRTLIIILFTGSFLFLLTQHLYICYGLRESFNIMSLELANKQQGSVLLEQWYNQTEPLIPFAQLNTSVDFLFIIGYVGMLITISYCLMQNQREQHINNGLRFCLFLAVLAGLLDVAENAILLFDLFHYKPENGFVSSMYVSYPKWTLIIIILLFWLVSLAYNLLPKRITA